MAFPQAMDYERIMKRRPGERQLCSPDLDGINFGEIIRPPSGIGAIWGSGSFAVVYRCRERSGSLAALRLPLSPPASDVAERYRRLQEYQARWSPPCLVRARFFPKAVEVRGEWFPAFLMDWVEGISLKDYVEKLARERNRRALLLLADRWQQLLATLQGADIAHGDLQHDNVMVRSNGELCLVDYDTLYLPGMPGREILAGLPGYVHPAYIHRARPYNQNMDTFSGMIILLSLYALAADLSLYGRFTTDNLLLSAKDVESPQKSLAFRQLLASSDPLVRYLAGQIQKLCRAPDLADVPINTLLRAAPSSAGPAGAKPAAARQRPAAPQRPAIRADRGHSSRLRVSAVALATGTAVMSGLFAGRYAFQSNGPQRAHPGATPAAIQPASPRFLQPGGDRASITIQPAVIAPSVRLEHSDRLLPYTRRTIRSGTLAAGRRRVLRAGRRGTERITYRVVYRGGTVVSRNRVASKVVSSALPELIEIGTASLRATRRSAPLAGVIFCPSCGSRQSTGSRFCVRCGTAL